MVCFSPLVGGHLLPGTKIVFRIQIWLRTFLACQLGCSAQFGARDLQTIVKLLISLETMQLLNSVERKSLALHNLTKIIFSYKTYVSSLLLIIFLPGTQCKDALGTGSSAIQMDSGTFSGS